MTKGVFHVREKLGNLGPTHTLLNVMGSRLTEISNW
jgi:hypothetical protein